MFEFIKKWIQTPTYKRGLKSNIFIPKTKYARVISVYDGDTITISMKLFFYQRKYYKYKVRLAGIDCPELRTKDDNEKKIGYIAKKVVSDLILEKIIKLNISGYDKYGRLLADVKYNNINISELLLEKGLAVIYDGSTKNKVDWEKLVNEKCPSLLE